MSESSTSSLNSHESVKFVPSIYQNITIVLKFVKHPSKWSLRPNALLHVVLSCTCVNKEATCTRTNLMETMKISVFTFQLQFFIFFQFYPSFILTFHPEISLFSHKTGPTILLPAKTFTIFTSPK